MRRAALLLALAAALAAPLARADWLEGVSKETVLADAKRCAAEKNPEQIREFACFKPGGALSADTFVQIAADRLFQAVDVHAMEYLDALSGGLTAQPQEFSNSIAYCFAKDPAKLPVPALCRDVANDGTVRNLATSYAAACAALPGISFDAVAAYNATRAAQNEVVWRTDGWIGAALREEGRVRSSSSPSCTGLAARKLMAYRRAASLIAVRAVFSGYDVARRKLVSDFSKDYEALLVKMQRLSTKLDIVNDKWKKRTKDVKN